ncbi:MAG: glycoside hydrolase family protein [Polyangia bacterium]
MSRPFAMATIVFLGLGATAELAVAKSMIDYFQPIPAVGKLTSSTWGAAEVLPRDVSNGLETPDKKYFFWDGKILKVDGKYHLFGSRWPKSAGFNMWSTSITIHAVSDTALGPYVDKGQIYDRNGGRGHNVSAVAVPDGTFAVYTSDVTPGDFYTAPAVDGPWTFKGSINIDKKGYNIPAPTANITVAVRPDNTFLATQRSGFMYVGGTNVVGPYAVPGPSVWPNISGLNNANAEDPVLWYSGGYYHITVNWWDARVAHHLMSKDGVTNWKDMGVAYDPRSSFIRYTDGTVNKWYNLERPGVVMENGHVTHFTFAATDINKTSITGTDNHGSKIIVIPFDGVAFDADNGGEGAGGAGGKGGAAGGAAGGGAAGGVAGGGGRAAGSGGDRGGTGGAAGQIGTGGAGLDVGGSAGTSDGGGTGGDGAGPATGGVNGSGGRGNGSGGNTSASGGAAGPAHGGTGGQATTSGQSPGTDSGCACSLGSGRGSASSSFLLFVALAASAQLRRARRRRRPRA